MIMKKLKINYFFDIIHPQSYIGFQLLKKSIPILSNYFNTNVEFFPVSCLTAWSTNKIIPFEHLQEDQRSLLNDEIENICRSYSLNLHNMNVNRKFEEPLNKCRLLYLTMIKKEHPDLYFKFIETFFQKTWNNGMEINRGYILFKISLELGLPFHVVDDLVSRTETQINKNTIKAFHKILDANECKNLPVTSFQLEEDCENKLFIDSIMKLIPLYDLIQKDPCSLEKVVERYCKYEMLNTT